MSEPILATDAERDTALALLRDASVDGRLTVEHLAERAELVHAARTRDDLAPPTRSVRSRQSIGKEIKAQIRRHL